MIAWPEDHVAELHRLRRDKLTFTAVAEAINLKFGTAYTRNSVAGKCQKLGLSKPCAVKLEKPKATPPQNHDRPNRTNTGIGPAVQKINRIIQSEKGNYSLNGSLASGLIARLKSAKEAEQSGPKTKGDGYKPKTVEVATLDIRLVDLEPMQCRFACVRVDEEWRFCGHPKKQGSSYCPEHHALAWNPRTAPVKQSPHYRNEKRRAA